MKLLFENWRFYINEARNKGFRREVYEKELGKAYVEIVQLAAVCMAWAEALRRRGILNEK